LRDKVLWLWSWIVPGIEGRWQTDSKDGTGHGVQSRVHTWAETWTVCAEVADLFKSWEWPWGTVKHSKLFTLLLT